MQWWCECDAIKAACTITGRFLLWNLNPHVFHIVLSWKGMGNAI